MKFKRQVIMVIISIMLVVFCFFSIGAKENSVNKILSPTPLYLEADFDSQKVLEEIKQNEKIDLIGDSFFDVDGNRWQKISYLNYQGYVLYQYIYFTIDTSKQEVQIVRATSTYMGEIINVYRFYNESSEIVGTLNDAERVSLIVEDGAEYGEFSKIIYKDEFYFVKSINLTDGISYNQKLAVIITSGLVGGLLIICVVVFLVRRKKITHKD